MRRLSRRSPLLPSSSSSSSSLFSSPVAFLPAASLSFPVSTRASFSTTLGRSQRRPRWQASLGSAANDRPTETWLEQPTIQRGAARIPPTVPVRGNALVRQLRWATSSSSSLPSSSSSSPAPPPPPSGRPKTAIFFPGQGVQKVGMLTPWLEAFPATARAIVEEIDHYMGYKLSDVIQDGPGKKLTATPNAQPAIMATSILILRILEREFGFRVAAQTDVTLGHSLGEFAALVAGGYLQFEDALYLVRRRAEAMARATQAARDAHGGEYGMVAVVTEPEYLGPLIEAIYKCLGYPDGKGPARRPLYRDDYALDDHHAEWDEDGGGMAITHPPPPPKEEQPPSATLSPQDEPPASEQVLIANINSKNQIVLSGNIARIQSLMAQVRRFLGHDPRAVRLNSDSPFHSPIMRPAVAEVRRLLAGHSRVKGRESEDIIHFPGCVPCISNVSARPFGSRTELKDLLARQCEETILWWDSIRYLDQEVRVRRWVGIGPGKVGRNLVGKEVGMRGKDLVKGGGVWAITDPSEIEEVLRGLEETASFVDEE